MGRRARQILAGDAPFILTRERGMATATRQKQDASLRDDIEARVDAIDWMRVAADLDAHGWASFKKLLAADECEALAGLYDCEDRFRSTVVMSRHGFGRGEYKY